MASAIAIIHNVPKVAIPIAEALRGEGKDVYGPFAVVADALRAVSAFGKGDSILAREGLIHPEFSVDQQLLALGNLGVVFVSLGGAVEWANGGSVEANPHAVLSFFGK